MMTQIQTALQILAPRANASKLIHALYGIGKSYLARKSHPQQVKLKFDLLLCYS